MKRTSRHGTVYQEGSSNSYAGWEPRRCYVCGERIVKSRQAVGFSFDDITGNHQAWHLDCAAGPRRTGMGA